MRTLLYHGHFINIFLSPGPLSNEIFCKPPMRNMSNYVEDWVKIAHPIKEVRGDFDFIIDFCHIFEDANHHAHQFLNDTDEKIELFHKPTNHSRLVPCESFEHKPIYTSIITQFDLYCSRDILVATTQFFHLFGVLSGGIVTTWMLKYIEPRQTMLIGMFTVCKLTIQLFSIRFIHTSRRFHSKSFAET